MNKQENPTRQVTNETLENIGLMEEAEFLVGRSYKSDEISEKLIRVTYQLLRNNLALERANDTIDNLEEELYAYRRELQSKGHIKEHIKNSTQSITMSGHEQ